MPEIDLREEYLEPISHPTESQTTNNEEDEDLFDELEKELDNDALMGQLREQRIKELTQEISQKMATSVVYYGRLTEMRDEKEIIKTSADEKRCIIHFCHKDFRRCQIMNNQLELLAPKYPSTRFLRVLVENVPWLVEKLQIKILPCVICFIDGVTKDRLIGFEELGNTDSFQLATLELRLQLSGVLEKPTTLSRPAVQTTSRSGIRRSVRSTSDDYDSDE